MNIPGAPLALLLLLLLCALGCSTGGAARADDDKQSSTKGNFDGPAELPRATVNVAVPRQTGKTLRVREGDDLQDAFDRARCGDTIELQAAASFTGSYTLPSKPCDDSHWILVRTSAPDSALPADGHRLTPCYSGVAGLPGRPALNCASTKVVTARIVGKTNLGPLTFAAGANHYRFLGLELTRVPPSPKPPVVYKIAGPAEGAAVDHIIFDRVWAHGTVQDETAHGIRLNGVRDAAIVNSTFTDFHCVAISGTCTDAQAISGGNGNLPAGPFLIENNFLEASGENILFGGGPGTVTPTDITIRRNHLFKPLTWRKGEAGFVGGLDGNAFIVKNLFELKVGTRVLFEDNVLEYSWGGFSQAGFAILLTPRNGAPTPSTQITDVTIRNCIVRHTGSGMQLGNPAGEPAASVAGERYSIHDLAFYDIDHEKFDGHGNLAQVSMSPKPGTPVLQHVKIDHVSAFPPRLLLTVGGPYPAEMNDFTFTNNLVSAGELGVNPTGSPCNLPRQRDPESMIRNCFKSFEFSHNVIVAGGAAGWPKGNTSARDFNEAGMEKHGELYLPGPRLKGKGSDGKDIGANLEAIEAAVAGVE